MVGGRVTKRFVVLANYFYGLTNETPYTLAFGSKVMVPIEISLPT